MRFSAKSGAVLAALTTLMLAGCWGSGDGATTEETPSPGQKIKPTGDKWTRVVPLSPQQKIAQTGNKWAPLFAAGRYRAACKYQTYSLCSRAKLSNGKLVEFLGRQPVPCIGSACPRPVPDAWLVHKVGSNAGKRYFEP